MAVPHPSALDGAVDSVVEPRGDLDVLTWPVFGQNGCDAVVTTRGGGVSAGPYSRLNLGLHVGDDPAAVVENRRRAAAALGADLSDLVFARQTHGRRVVTVGDADRSRGVYSDRDAIADTDALVTATPGVGLVMMAADCSPIVLYDPDAHVLACVHAGWRGATAGVIEAALAVMTELGARAERCLAGVGPTVSASRYQVGPDVRDAARAAFGDLAGILAPDGTGRWTFDLGAANRRALRDAGVAPDRTHASAADTGGDDFFSDRAARPCGRHAVIARIRAPEAP